MANLIIIGIGNPSRGDDAVGWSVIDCISSKVNGTVDLSKQQGDIAEIVDIFSRYAHVFIIDACQSDAAVGTWRRIDALKEPLPREPAQTSTHGFNLGQAIALAQNLGQLPSQLVVYAICGEQFSMGAALSPLLKQAVEEVTEALLNEETIRTCMNKV